MKILQLKNLVPIAFIAMSTFVIISCNSDDGDNENDKTAIELGREAQINNLFDNQIKPLQQNHIQLSSTLFEQSQIFETAINVENLVELKNAWKSSFLLWKQMEIYNLGEIQTSFIHLSIDQWPVNTSVIENNINGSTIEIDDSYIASLGAPAKGYAAIEYLLFNENEQTIIDAFNNGQNAVRRLQYLVALCKNLNEKAVELKSKWHSYESAFKTTLTTGVDGSQNQVVNALVAAIENIKNKKLDAALSSATPNPELLEAYRSEQSKQAIAANLKSVFDTYKGNFNNQEGFGLEEYVSQILNRADINTSIITAFADAQSALDQISSSLEVSVVTQTAQVVAFQNRITALIALFKVDLSSAANIVITFNDNDGD